MTNQILCFNNDIKSSDRNRINNELVEMEQISTPNRVFAKNDFVRVFNNDCDLFNDFLHKAISAGYYLDLLCRYVQNYPKRGVDDYSEIKKYDQYKQWESKILSIQIHDETHVLCTTHLSINKKRDKL